jgi:alkanesulfonate monooxygenase SsuD/methylene tetrahydromethanopterin reductase-like flavin-dependent oxidoreductase (luciferase family)
VLPARRWWLGTEVSGDRGEGRGRPIVDGAVEMKTGVILPTFQETPDQALAVAREAEGLGVDGVFCYDHLWPMGQPERPALAPFPLLAVVATTTSRLVVGTLVARVGLVPEPVLVSEFDALEALAPGRVVAGLGTGDRKSAAENRSYGVPYGPADERRAALWRTAQSLRHRGIPVWVGAGGGGTGTIAAWEGEGVAANVWSVPPSVVIAWRARTEVTWAGPAPTGPEAAAELLQSLSAAGATWAVLGWPAPLAVLAAHGEG